MRILMVDDDPEQLHLARDLIIEVTGARVDLVESVEGAVAALVGFTYELVITDIFIPLGPDARATMGPRARRYEETVQHLGGLVLLDEIDRMDPAPIVLTHTACTDFALLEILGERVRGRIPKPAPVDVLLRAVLEAMGLPVPS